MLAKIARTQQPSAVYRRLRECNRSLSSLPRRQIPRKFHRGFRTLELRAAHRLSPER